MCVCASGWWAGCVCVRGAGCVRACARVFACAVVVVEMVCGVRVCVSYVRACVVSCLPTMGVVRVWWAGCVCVRGAGCVRACVCACAVVVVVLVVVVCVVCVFRACVLA